MVNHSAPVAFVYTNEASAYSGLPRRHGTVKHSRGDYVSAETQTHGIESLWATLNRAYVGTYRYISERHLDGYVKRFAGRNNIRDLHTIEVTGAVAGLMTSKRIRYAELMAE